MISIAETAGFHVSYSESAGFRPESLGQRAVARTKTVEDILASKGLLVDQSAYCRRGGKGDFTVDAECYYRSAVE